MTVTEQKRALTRKFEAITAQVVTGGPDDFDNQLPLTPESFDPETRSMLCSFQVDSKFGTTNTFAHGGIVATMLDIAQGAAIAAYAQEGDRITTVSLQISYLKPVRTGEKFYVRTKISKISTNTAFCSAEAWQDEGSLTNSTTGVYHLGKRKK